MIIKRTDYNCSDAHPKQSVCAWYLYSSTKQINAEVVSSSLTWSTFWAFLYQGKSHKAFVYVTCRGSFVALVGHTSKDSFISVI